MQKRETSKQVEMDDRKWIIGRFDPMTGTYVAYKLMSEFIPMIPGIGAALGAALPGSGGKTMSKADFLDLQRDCLSVCSEVLPAGNAPVINQNGTWGVQNFDVKLCLGLIVQVLIFNLADFFDDSLWSALAGAMQASGFPLPGAPQ